MDRILTHVSVINSYSDALFQKGTNVTKLLLQILRNCFTRGE